MLLAMKPMLLTLLLPALSCSGSSHRADGGSGSDSGNGSRLDGGLDASSADDSGPIDTARDPACDRGSWVVFVTGRVVDETGAEVAGALAQLCVHHALSGQLFCLRAVPTDDAGTFTITVPERARCMESAAVRVVVPYTDLATLYCGVRLPPDEPAVEVSGPYVLYQTQPAVTLPEEGDGQELRTVAFADGLEIDVAPARFYGAGDGYQALAARRFAGDAVELCFSDDTMSFEGIYALSPEGDVGGQPFALRIPNSTALAPEAVVDLYVLGGITCSLGDGTGVAPAEWRRYGQAAVDTAGDSIVADAAAGLPCFTWFGYRLEN